MGKGKLRAFKINLLNESQEYFAGSYIEGNVFLELSKEMIPVKSIKVRLSGMARVQWRDQHGINGGRTYRNFERICRLTWTIWRNEGIGQQQATTTGLPAGQYEFPFKIQIPADLELPTSFEGPCGAVRYSVIAGITRSQETKLKHATAEGIVVKDTVNTNITDLIYPLSNFRQKMVRTFWHTYGSASLLIMTDKGGYCPGEFIAFTVKVENQSTKQINAIYTSLVQTANYHGHCVSIFQGSHQKNSSAKRILQSIEGSGIPAGKTGQWSNGLMLVPDTPATTEGHHIIVLSYAVDVTLVFHKADNLNLQIPITIGTNYSI